MRHKQANHTESRNRKLAILGLILLSPFLQLSTAAQDRGILYPEAFYASVDLGASLFNPGDKMAVGIPTIGLTGGYWISTPLAFQVDARAVLGSGQGTLAMASGEFKWDINHTFFHTYNENFLKPIPFYPLFGLGGMWQFGSQTDRSLLAMVGLQAPMRIGRNFDAILQYKCYLLPQSFGKEDNTLMHTISLGLLYSQHPDPFHRRPEYESRRHEDWFIGFGMGANYSAFDLITNPDRGGFSMVGVAPELMFGRNFSNFWAVRVELTGLTAHEIYDTVAEQPQADYSFTVAHFDMMINLNNMLHFRRGKKWAFMPYLGAGAMWRYDTKAINMTLDGGLFVRRYVSQHSDVFADLKYFLIPPTIAGGAGPSGSSLGVGIPTLTVGYIYNFGHSTTRYRLPYNCAD